MLKKIKYINHKELKDILFYQPEDLFTQEQIVEKNDTLLDDQGVDYNPEDDGWMAVETESGKMFYIEEQDGNELENFVEQNKLLK